MMLVNVANVVKNIILINENLLLLTKPFEPYVWFTLCGVRFMFLALTLHINY